MGTKITDHYFEFESLKYFRDNAHLIKMGSFGRKRDAIGAKSYLEVQAKIKDEYLEGHLLQGKPVYIDWASANSSQLVLNGKLNVFGVNLSLATGYNFAKLKSAKVNVYSIAINEGPLKKILNTEAAGARTFLKDEGKDGRVVSECWILMEGELAEHFATSTGLVVKLDDLGLKLVAKGGSKGTQTIILSEGSVFAYRMHKVAKWDGNLVDDMTADYHG